MPHWNSHWSLSNNTEMPLLMESTILGKRSLQSLTVQVCSRCERRLIDLVEFLQLLVAGSGMSDSLSNIKIQLECLKIQTAQICMNFTEPKILKRIERACHLAEPKAKKQKLETAKPNGLLRQLFEFLWWVWRIKSVTAPKQLILGGLFKHYNWERWSKPHSRNCPYVRAFTEKNKPWSWGWSPACHLGPGSGWNLRGLGDKFRVMNLGPRSDLVVRPGSREARRQEDFWNWFIEWFKKTN